MRALASLAPLAWWAGCGDNTTLSPAPDIVVAGPVAIDTRTLTLTVGDLAIDQFLSLGVVDEIDETHYYDPRGDRAVSTITPERALGADGDTIVLDGGVRFRLAPCEALASCAALDVEVATASAVHLTLAIATGPGEPLFGTGDAPGGANVAGSVREMQLRIDPESQSSLNETHVPVPLVLLPRHGVGVFAADDRPAALDLAARAADRITITLTLPSRGPYRFLLFTADQPVELVRSFAALTARPALPPRWAFAPQQWRNVWNSSAEMLADADDMRSRGIAGSVMWIDNPWQTAYNTFTVDESRLAAPAQLISDLTARGYKVVFWSTPYVGLTAATAGDRSEGAARELFVTDDAGAVIDYPWQDGPGAMVDFTRDGATAWWRDRIARAVALGAAGFKLDFGEEIVSDIAGTVVAMHLAAGDNSSHHRRYAEGYHGAYLGALPPGEGFLITRAGAWGEQRVNPAIWPGDLASDFSRFGELDGEGKRSVGGLPSAISRGLSLSLSGYPFYGSDIGGFRGFPTTEALVRWAEYAALGTIMQLGGGGKSHNPWDAALFDPAAEAIYRRFAQLHIQLNPLLWTLAQRAARDGTPVTTPASFATGCQCDDATFLLGDNIVVAPVIEPGATTRTVVLPIGEWMDSTTGEIVVGDGVTSRTVPAPLGELPRWQRRGTLTPMFARAADTVLPATAPGVTSYADPAFGRELRLVYAPGPVALEGVFELALHDGARAVGLSTTTIAVAAGSEYSVFTLDVDARHLEAPLSAPAAVAFRGVDLAAVGDETVCGAPGCFRFDAATKRLLVRVFATTTLENIEIR